jgi:uncharacterized protein YjbI with pentapeptide repeats
MKIEIKNLYGRILYECEAESIKEAVEKAVKEGVSLYKAILIGENLKGINLSGACLIESSLIWSNLEEANLENSNLEGADFQGANLKGANLNRVNICWSNPSWAVNLEGTKMFGYTLRKE